MWEVYILPLGVKRGVNVLNITISLTSFIFMTTPWFYTMMSFFNKKIMMKDITRITRRTPPVGSPIQHEGVHHFYHGTQFKSLSLFL